MLAHAQAELQSTPGVAAGPQDAATKGFIFQQVGRGLHVVKTSMCGLMPSQRAVIEVPTGPRYDPLEYLHSRRSSSNSKQAEALCHLQYAYMFLVFLCPFSFEDHVSHQGSQALLGLLHKSAGHAAPDQTRLPWYAQCLAQILGGLSCRVVLLRACRSNA